MRQCCVEIAFVNEENVTVAVGDSVHTENGQIDEYDSDSDDEGDSACGDDFSEVPVCRACVRSRRSYAGLPSNGYLRHEVLSVLSRDFVLIGSVKGDILHV